LTRLDIQTPRWMMPFFDEKTYKGVYGGRGSGKSHAVAEYIVERCVAAKTDVVCLREVQRSLNFSVKKLIESKIEKFGVGHLFDVQYDKIKCSNGGMIIFNGLATHSADSIKSLEGFDIFWFEEAQSCSRRSMDLLLPTLRKEGGEIVFTWNPDQATDPVDVLFRTPGKDLPDSVCIRVNYDDNPWFPDVLQKQMHYMRDRDPDKYAHIWLGEYNQRTEARVFKNWTVEEFETPDNAVHRLGADFGFSIDPTVLLRCHITGRKMFIDYEAYSLKCEITHMPELFMQVPDAEKWPMCADSSRPETISHLRNHGFPKITASVKGSRSVEEGISWLQAYDIIVHPRCRHTIDELSTYKWKVDDMTGDILPVLADKDNHLIDALRYANENLRRAANTVAVTDYTPLPKAGSWS